MDETNLGLSRLIGESYCVEHVCWEPVNTATKKEILFQKGDGTRVAKTAAFYTNGTDGIIQYVAVANDISVAGTWYLQGYVEMGGGKYYSEILPFSVKENLTAAS